MINRSMIVSTNEPPKKLALLPNAVTALFCASVVRLALGCVPEIEVALLLTTDE